MPLADLLNPIPGAKRGGENLRYAGLYDKAKEARREEEDVPTGEWQHERKKADYKLVDKLCNDALVNKTKDLWCAAWLTEAWLRTKGIPGLLDGLQLANGLIESFWDDLYPELEDGDAELRATPLEWIGSQLELAIKNCRLTSKGLSLLQQKEAKSVGYEADCADNEEKATKRAQDIADGKISAEMFDEGVAATPKSFYVTLLGQVDACTAELDKIDAAGSKFGEASPSFGILRNALEEYRQAVNSLLNKKRETEPDEEPAAGGDAVEVEAETAGDGTAVARARVFKAGTIAEPQDEESALKLIFLGARYLRKENSSNPAPYQMLRALRFGKLRESGSIDSSQLEAPATEVRKKLKALATDAAWEDVLETAESTLETKAGAAWLDLHRYAARACEELGRTGAAGAIKGEVRLMLMDFPTLKEMSMNDDTPTAGPETLSWLKELSAPKDASSADEVPGLDEKPSPAATDVVDAYELAKRAATSGHPQDAIEILSREAAQQRCGRDRFHRRVQLAQICMSAEYYGLAQPILQELYEEVESRHLTDWETPELVGHAMGLLYRCLNKNGGSDEQKQTVYTKLCRFDPVLALQFSK